MELRKKSYLVRFTYPFGDTPNQTSVCRMFWRVVWMALVGWPFLLVVGTIAFCIIVIFLIGAIIVNGFFGRYVVLLQKRKSDENAETGKQADQALTRPIPWLPSLAGARIAPSVVLLPFTWAFGYRPALYPEDDGYLVRIERVVRIWTIEVKPIYPIVLVAIASSLVLACDDEQLWLIGKVSAASIGAILIVAVIVAGLILGIKSWRRSDASFLAREYFRARKEKVCPTIYIVD